MTTIDALLASRPHPYPVPVASVAACVQAVASCAVACRTCVAGCLGEDDVAAMARCIRLDLDCAAMCDATAGMLIGWTADDRGEDHVGHAVRACAAVCARCADECAGHEDMEHCALCAAACRAAEQECLVLTAALAA